MIQLFCLMLGLKGDIYAQLLEQFLIHVREDNRGVGLAAAQLVQLFDSAAGHGIGDRADGQGDKQLIGVQAGIVVAHVLHLEMLDRLDNAGGNEGQLLIYAGQIFERIEQAGRACAQQRAGLARDNSAVVKLKSYGRTAGKLGLVKGRGHYGSISSPDIKEVHNKLDLLKLAGVGHAHADIACSGIIAADYLLT